MSPERDAAASQLFKWYLALLRTDAQARAEEKSLTPLTLVERDRNRIHELIAQRTQMRAERSERIRSELSKRSAGERAMLALIPGAARLVDRQVAAAGTMLGALESDIDPAAGIDEIAKQVVSELEQHRQSEQMIADYTSDLLCCLDENRLILDINLEFSLLSGYQKMSVMAVPIDQLIDSEQRAEFIDYLQRRRTATGPEKHEASLKTAHGDQVDLEWTAEWSEAARCYFCLAKNITERKQRDRLRKQIVSMARHDLRAPLTGIGLVLEQVQLGVYGPVSEMGTDQVTQARASINQLVEMVDKLIKANEEDLV